MIFFKSGLLRHNLYTVKFTFCKCHLTSFQKSYSAMTTTAIRVLSISYCLMLARCVTSFLAHLAVETELSQPIAQASDSRVNLLLS